MSNQKSNDPDWLTDRLQQLAESFRSIGIEPIYIDPNDSRSIDKGLAEVDERIRDVAKSKDGNNDRD